MKAMEFIVISIAHEGIQVREQVSFTISQKLDFLNQIHKKKMDQVVILSTCNRSEVYVYANVESIQELVQSYRAFFHLTKEQHIETYHGVDALQHVMEVSCGWDSMIVGEDQILKQVKDAYAFAKNCGSVQKELHLIFQEVFRIAKKMKHKYQGSEHPRTTSYVAIKRLKEAVDLKDKKVLLIGGGSIIQECLPYLRDEEVQDVYMAVRNPQKYRSLKEVYPGFNIVPFLETKKLWSACDVIISATASPHLVVSYDDIKSDDHKRYVLDLALPRDIDPRFQEDKNYCLWDIDDIQRVVRKHNEMREKACFLGKAKIHEEALHICHKLQQSSSEPFIADMQKRLMDMAQNTYELLNQKLDLQEHERRTMKKIVTYSSLRFIQDWRVLIEDASEEELACLCNLFKKEE